MPDPALLAAAATAAYGCERETGCPASLTLAQWTLESGWGKHSPGNNCFGIKAYPGCYGTQLLTTREVISGVTHIGLKSFATFPTLQACFEKHANLITSGKFYAEAWASYLQSKDELELAASIAKIYATDPNYTSLLHSLMNEQTIQNALKMARLPASIGLNAV